ncbi:baeRF10 domain-containing protein [Occallatibacter riparius]|uniref:eRF1 domain-containing protein n=1 Tax=Occallatibacter riparius TaxID=1002689 RepID=A0A9J7BQV1_9BACT|nr:hypothetical protein [Occallatibacter riparius]UWZ84945.1 hypothetical protein MOP44_03155 [Occallatibacter riparius]
MAIVNSKITLDELQELARFWSEDRDAISVYFKAPAPSELAHREEPIFAKDQIKQKLGSLKGMSHADREDVQRILETVSELKGNNGRAKVIFACWSKGIWREYDAPGDFGCRIDVGPNFSLAPLIAQQQGRRRYCIALADRNRARLLLLEAREITEHSQVIDEDDKEKIRTTGTGKSVHLERKKDEQVRRHFTFVAEHLLHFYEHKDYDCLIVGCRDDMWPAIEAELHPDLKRVLAGHFHCDPGIASCEEIQEKAQALVDVRDRVDEQKLMERTMGGFASNALGAVGINEVIDALEKGEVRTLLWTSKPDGEQHSASLCEHCGHLEGKELNACTLCGGKMRLYQNAEEALLRHALGRSIEVREMHYSKLPMPDRIAAWLRFRAEISTPQALAS